MIIIFRWINWTTIICKLSIALLNFKAMYNNKLLYLKNAILSGNKTTKRLKKVKKKKKN